MIKVILLFVTTAMFSQNREIIYLRSTKVLTQSEEKSVSEENTIIENNITKITKVEKPSIEIFKPESSISNGIGIIVCPGGGYNILAIDLEGYEIATWLNKLGYTVFVLKYSVPNKRNEALDDLKKAIKIVRGQSEIFKINPNNIGVLGFSAGASLCARASTSFNEEIDEISDKPNFALLIYPAYLDTGKNNIVLSELSIGNKTPPMFIFGTEDDPYGNSALVMANSLSDKSVPYELHFLPKGGHGYGLRKGNIAAETWPGLAEVWLNKILPIKKKYEMKNYNVNSIKEEALIITGKGESVLWKRAETLTDFVSAWDDEPVKKIEFRALWDSENLFFYFKVYDNQVHIDKKDDSVDSIGNSDRVELFFRTDELLNPYYCLEIDSSPRIMDFMAYPNKNFDFNWNWPKDDILVKSNISKDFFTVEIAISLASLKQFNLIKDNKIEAGIFRAKYNEQENLVYKPTWISWVNPNTETPNFHIASSFGVLNLLK